MEEKIDDPGIDSPTRANMGCMARPQGAWSALTSKKRIPEGALRETSPRGPSLLGRQLCKDQKATITTNGHVSLIAELGPADLL
jgi:hypothetical protein